MKIRRKAPPLGDKRTLIPGTPYRYQVAAPNAHGRYVKIWFGAAVVDRALTVTSARAMAHRRLKGGLDIATQ